MNQKVGEHRKMRVRYGYETMKNNGEMVVPSPVRIGLFDIRESGKNLLIQCNDSTIRVVPVVSNLIEIEPIDMGEK